VIMFADVVPIKYLPRGIDQEFTYRLPVGLQKNIKPGQLVIIPFRRQNIQGAAVRIYHEQKTAIKKILGIKAVLPYPPLTFGQRGLIDELENHYGASRTLAYKTVVSRLTAKIHLVPPRQGEQAKNQRHRQKSTALPLAKINRRTLRLLLGARSKLTIIGSLYDPRHPLFIEYIRRRLKNRGQVLLLFPDNESAEIAKKSYEKYFNEFALVIWSSRAPISQLGLDWMRISTGEASVIFATRSGPFLPFKSLRSVILFDEADDNYKSWDQQPYYDTRYLAERLTAFEQVPFLTTRILPPLWPKNRILGRIQAGAKAKLIILDRRVSREENRAAIIPEAALKAIGQSSTSAQSLVFVNRLGYAAVLCNDCQYAFRCSACHSFLTYFTHAPVPLGGTVRGSAPRNPVRQEATAVKPWSFTPAPVPPSGVQPQDPTSAEHSAAALKCQKCGHIENNLNSCPHCHGLKLRYFGLGIERILEELKHKFPNKIIQRLDRDSLKKSSNLFALLNKIKSNQVEITVATSIILPRLWALPLFNTVTIMQAESLFLSPQWHANEDGLTAIHQLWAAAKQYCYVETNLPEHPAIKAVKSGQESEFAKHELYDRKRFHYPPYARLIKLTAANQQFVLPRSIEDDHNLNIVNLDQQKNKKTVLIKAPLDYKLNQLWPHLDANWKIDVDPVSIS